MDRLPRAMAAELGDRVRYGARVTAVEQKTASVVVHYRTVGGNFAETADAAVMTVPFPILRHIPITPPLSAGKRKAIRELHYDGATKIFLQFRRRFWETDEGIRGGRSVTDLPVRNVHYPSPCDGCGHGATGRGVLLASYTWGADSRRWTSLPEAERVARALDNVAELHGPAIRELFEAGASKSWDDDEFAGGAYALFQPGQQTTLHDDIAGPEGRLHFAGEHTTLQHAWVEGAVESGLRAAEEIHLTAVGSGRDRPATPTASIRPVPGLVNGPGPKALVKSIRLAKRTRRV
jgi:monoamine oxidase